MEKLTGGLCSGQVNLNSIGKLYSSIDQGWNTLTITASDTSITGEH